MTDRADDAAAHDDVASCGARAVWLAPVTPRPYLLVGGAAGMLAGTLGTSVIIVVASRAFAAYHALQSTVALRTSNRRWIRVGYGVLAVLMVAITFLAQPAH